ncbi:MAG: addiction module toxin RelE, partial [Nitrospirales bacterium]|nr:addiction module toxin RelE [Nitrospirales bacterium]
MDDDDRLLFLDTLQRVNTRYNWFCRAYCLMDNHYHLIIETPDGNLSLGMRQLNGIYTQAFNRRHDRVGHVFQGRFKAILIDKESHLAEVCRYVVLNPVRADMVKSPDDWRWSSYQATAGTEAPHGCLTTDWIIGLFAKRRETARRKYSEFALAGTGKEPIWNHLQGQVVLSNEKFRERFLDYLKGREDIQGIPK